mgnify:CR=1 FL=1
MSRRDVRPSGSLLVDRNGRERLEEFSGSVRWHVPDQDRNEEVTFEFTDTVERDGKLFWLYSEVEAKPGLDQRMAEASERIRQNTDRMLRDAWRMSRLRRGSLLYRLRWALRPR